MGFSLDQLVSLDEAVSKQSALRAKALTLILIWIGV